MFFASLFGLWFVLFPPATVKPYYPCGDGIQAQVDVDRTTPPGCRR